ncbi:MAG: response regulator [Segetibacter sp.]|jgi:CheY-like chemotaxis protein|nr:response regulator [Segetibacter sp.]
MSAKNVVLYADDDPDDIQLVREAFYNYSQNVELVTVADGLEALSFLKNLSSEDPAPCLIILDINMPRMDGKEALMKVRQMKRFEEVPSILFTTSSQQRDKDFAEKYNAGFLTKPIDYTQIDVIASKFIEHCSDRIKKNVPEQFQ